MKYTFLVFVMSSLFGYTFSQTLYIPSGTGGIGSPSNGTNNVGIGTSAPSVKLVVYDAGNASGTRVVLGNPVTDSGGHTALQLGTTNDSNGSCYLNSIKSAGSQYGDLYINQNGGNVGVGTSAPATKLHVATPNTSTISMFESTGTTNSWISVKNSVAQLNVGIGSTGLTNGFTYLYSSSGKFMIGADGSPTMTVAGMSNGNVGIGTTTPDQKLTVNGIVHASEVQIDLSVPAPDYVFEKNYPLPSLKQIEKYISSYMHLPDVPAAKEMEANGVNVGEMNMMLLKKVEELTLYIIEQQKQIDELKKVVYRKTSGELKN